MSDNIVRIVFKKSWQPKSLSFDGLFGFIITMGNFMDGIFNSACHVELDFCDASPDPINGRGSWSAFEGGDKIDPKTGKMCDVGFSAMSYEPKRWNIFEIDVTDERLPKTWKNKECLRMACYRLSGRKYDWEGIVGQALNIPKIHNKKQFFCSEAVGHMFGWGQLSPAQLQNKLLGLGFEFIK